jgi:PIN domain nuclease of toxin-antitoxin system
MIRAVTDTHTIIWYLYDDARLSPTARTWIENAAAAGDQIALSTITLAEIIYLIEKGRVSAAALTRLMTELDATDAVLVEIPFDRHIVRAMSLVARTEVPDLPDRIISATALHLGVPIISRDRRIQASGLRTVW